MKRDGKGGGLKITLPGAAAVLALLALACAPTALGASAEAAEYRHHARELYRSLRTPSCEGAARGFDRTDLLRAEEAAIRTFELNTRKSPQYFHLMIARDDAAYELKVSNGCWADDDIRFATMHVEMTRERVRSSLEAMQALAPSLAGTVSESSHPPLAAAEFRYRVRDLVTSIHPMCPLSDRAATDDLLAQSRAEASRFRGRLRGSPYALHYDIAEADVRYFLSTTVADCVTPSSAPPGNLRAAALAETRRKIAAAEAVIR